MSPLLPLSSSHSAHSAPPRLFSRTRSFFDVGASATFGAARDILINILISLGQRVSARRVHSERLVSHAIGWSARGGRGAAGRGAEGERSCIMDVAVMIYAKREPRENTSAALLFEPLALSPARRGSRPRPRCLPALAATIHQIRIERDRAPAPASL